MSNQLTALECPVLDDFHSSIWCGLSPEGHTGSMNHQRVGFSLLVLVPLSACDTRGGEGEGCLSEGIFGPLYCDSGLLCDTPAHTCVRPMSQREGRPCGSNEVCAAGLFCACASDDNCGISLSGGTCRPRLGEGEVCGSDATCDASLVCSFTAGSLTSACISPDRVVDLRAIVDRTLVAFTDVTASSMPAGQSQQFQVDGTVPAPESRHLTVRLTAPQGAGTVDVTCASSAAGQLEVTYGDTTGTFTSVTGDPNACGGSFTVVSSGGGMRLRGQFSATVQGGGLAQFFIGRGHVDVPVL
jgi:hypothetical protein